MRHGMKPWGNEMDLRGNPYGYELGFTVHDHVEDLIDRLGKAIKRIRQLEVCLGYIPADEPTSSDDTPQGKNED